MTSSTEFGKDKLFHFFPLSYQNWRMLKDSSPPFWAAPLLSKGWHAAWHCLTLCHLGWVGSAHGSPFAVLRGWEICLESHLFCSLPSQTPVYGPAEDPFWPQTNLGLLKCFLGCERTHGSVWFCSSRCFWSHKTPSSNGMPSLLWYRESITCCCHTFPQKTSTISQQARALSVFTQFLDSSEAVGELCDVGSPFQPPFWVVLSRWLVSVQHTTARETCRSVLAPWTVLHFTRYNLNIVSSSAPQNLSTYSLYSALLCVLLILFLYLLAGLLLCNGNRILPSSWVETICLCDTPSLFYPARDPLIVSGRTSLG